MILALVSGDDRTLELLNRSMPVTYVGDDLHIDEEKAMDDMVDHLTKLL